MDRSPKVSHPIDLKKLKARARAATGAKIKTTLSAFVLSARSTSGSAPFDWWAIIENVRLEANPAQPVIGPGIDLGQTPTLTDYTVVVPGQSNWQLYVELLFAVNPGSPPMPSDPSAVVYFDYNTRKPVPGINNQANQVPTGNANESLWEFVVPAPDGSATGPGGSPLIPQFTFAPRYIGGSAVRDQLIACTVLPFVP